jgi:hypothetical protein
MVKLKIAIVANCQAKPLARNITSLIECEINLIAIVHLLKNEDEVVINKKLAEADFIVSQLISDDYPAKFVSTSSLRSKFGSNLICIPNLYYMGYTPDLRYLRLPGAGTLQGPLGDYHSQIIFDSWNKEKSQSDALFEYENISTWEKRYSNAHYDSINQLRIKEMMTDVNISDVIEDEISRKRLFFTFNHPTNYLLLKLSKRIVNLFKHFSQPNNKGVDLLNGYPESLNQFMVPISDYVIADLGIKSVDMKYQIFQGMKKDNSNNKFYKVEYTLEQLIEEFYKEYDRNKVKLKSLLVR